MSGPGGERSPKATRRGAATEPACLPGAPGAPGVPVTLHSSAKAGRRPSWEPGGEAIEAGQPGLTAAALLLQVLLGIGMDAKADR